MHTIHSLFFVVLALIGPALAHMQLVFPAPFNASNNPHRTTAADPYLQFPYDCCGPNDRWTYPCRGYLHLMNTTQGAPTAEWPAGSAQSWSIGGIGNHYGGSCQVGFSIDKGETFRVITSYEGNCPHRNNGDGPEGQKFNFTVPGDIPAGVQVFAWVWYNREQEFNMNCAAVNITTSCASQYTQSGHELLGPSRLGHNANLAAISASPNVSGINQSSPPGGISFGKRPFMLIADNGNGCLTPKTTAEVKYPEPGPNLVPGDGAYPLELPMGNCSAPAMLARQSFHGYE